MGDTPRDSIHHLNQWARSSDVRTLLKGCEFEWAFSLLADDEDKRDNINFDLGTAFHTIPEEVLTQSMDIDSAIDHSIAVLDELLAAHTGDNPISGKRSLNPTILARNLDRMGRQWHQDIVVEAPFKGYDVAVEMTIVVPNIMRTQLDALYSNPDADDFVLVDWKSGTRSKADDMQLHIYEYGLRKNGTLPEEYQLESYFYFPWNADWQKAKPYPGDAVVAEWLATTAHRKAKIIDYGPACIPDWQCDYCAVQYSLCPVFNDGSWEKADALWHKRQPVLVNMEGKEVVS